jgi:phage FluMu protein gp41
MMGAPQDAPGCAKAPSSKQIIDRKQLAEAVKMLKKQQSVEFALGKQILGNEILSAFKIETLGDIQIPVSLEVR